MACLCCPDNEGSPQQASGNRTLRENGNAMIELSGIMCLMLDVIMMVLPAGQIGGVGHWSSMTW